jgi:RHS repeat-associated protein
MLISSLSGNSEGYRYGFQGQESDDEILLLPIPAEARSGFQGQESDDEIKGVGNSINYKYRMHDPRLGRFFAVDPHASSYPSLSGYSAFANNPINVIDPDGRDIIPVHGTWSNTNTWGNLSGIRKASSNLFGDNNLGVSFPWSGANYAQLRTKAAIQLVDHVRTQMQSEDFNGEITLVGHSHGGNVSIEALNMMAEMEEFDNVQLNLLTINTPVREDYQLSEKATGRVSHTNVYDSKDPVQSNGGNSSVVLPDLPRTPNFMDANTKGTGEYGSAGRTFKGARNIEVDNPQGFINGWNLNGGIQWGDYHNSHNRVNDWINKTEEK